MTNETWSLFVDYAIGACILTDGARLCWLCFTRSMGILTQKTSSLRGWVKFLLVLI